MGFLSGYAAAARVLRSSINGGSVQPAGVDLRVREVYVFRGPGFLGRGGERKLPPVERLEPGGGVWMLQQGAYRIVFAEVVSIPWDSVGFCYPRSSLLRMGASLYCAVWDPGYYGRGEALLVVHNPHGMGLAVGARVAQLVIARLEEAPHMLYQGVYLGENVSGARGPP